MNQEGDRVLWVFLNKGKGNHWLGDFLLPKFCLLIAVLHVGTVLVHLKSNLTKSLQLILWLYS